MWNLLKRKEERCTKLQDSLEEAAMELSKSASPEELLEELTADEGRHLEICSDCRKAADELVATKELFQGVMSFAEEERPWFAARVMAAIASGERELAQRITAWSEFPRFASRLAWVTSILLLAGTTWFYESLVRGPKYQSNGTPESIFEVPQQQATQDDILVSMAGEQP